MRSFERWWSGHRWSEHDGLHHAVLTLDGGYFLDTGVSIACTNERMPRDLRVVDGIPTCIACWTVVLT